MAKKNLKKVSLEEVPKVSEEKAPEETKKEPQYSVPQTDDYTLQVVVDYDGKIDPFFLSKKDPNFEYRFLRDERKNINIKTNNMLLQSGGWQICSKEFLIKRLGMSEDKDKGEISPDGLCRRGDTILAFMPKDLYKKKESYKSKLANDKIDAIKRLVDQGDKNVGKEIHDSMKGIQTEEQMGKVNWR